MIITVRIFALSLLLATSSWAEDKFRINGGEFDFGQVTTNVTVTHQIWVHAVGTDTLRINSVKSGCGCLVVPQIQDTIPPGDSLPLVFYWQTRGSAGARSQSAYLYFDSIPFPYEIVLKGNVVTPDKLQASVSWSPVNVKLSGSPEVELSGTFELTNRTAEKLSVSPVESGPGIVLVLPDSVEAGKTIVGRITIGKDNAAVLYEGSVTIDLSGNQGEIIRVSIPMQFGDFSFRPVFTTKEK